MGMAERPSGARALGDGWAWQFVRTLPVLMIVGGLLFDYFTPPAFTAVPLFVAAPLIAAPFVSLAGTVRTGAAAVLAIVALRTASGTLMHVVPVIEFFTVLTVSILAVVINGVVRHSNEQLASARFIAETAMRAVLPAPMDRIGGSASRRGTRRPRRTSTSAATCSPWPRVRTGCGSWSGTCAARGSRRSRRWP